MDAATIETLLKPLIALGLPGVIIIALAYAYRLKDKRIDELNDTLFEVGKETTKAMEASTAAINRLSDLLLRGKAD